MVQTERELRKTNLPKILMLLRSQSDLRAAAGGSEELLAGGELLGDHACRGEHGEAAVVQLDDFLSHVLLGRELVLGPGREALDVRVPGRESTGEPGKRREI